jgi:hypothetical protein
MSNTDLEIMTVSGSLPKLADDQQGAFGAGNPKAPNVWLPGF